MIKRLLVPLDATGTTEDVLPVVATFTTTGATVRLIHVAPVPGNVVTPEGRTIASPDQEMASVQAEWFESLGGVRLYRPPRDA